MKNVEITIEKWFKSGVTSAAICVFAFSLASYGFGFWNSLMTLPIGFIIGETIKNTLGESGGHWPARTSAVLTLLTGFIARAGGYYLSVTLDVTRMQKLGDNLPDSVFDFTFDALNRGDAYLIGLSMVIAYLKVFRSKPATSASPLNPATVSDERTEAPESVQEPVSSVSADAAEQSDDDITDFDRKRLAVESGLMFARITMLLVGAVAVYLQGDAFINARAKLEKVVRQQMQELAVEIDPVEYEEEMALAVQDVRLVGIPFGIASIVIVLAGILIHRAPIAAMVMALIAFNGIWIANQVMGAPMNTVLAVIVIVVNLVLLMALITCLQFKRLCQRLMTQGAADGMGG